MADHNSAHRSALRRAKAWQLGGWVWLLVAVLNLVIAGLRLAAGWPPSATDLTIAAISLFVAVVGWLLFGGYRRKASEILRGADRNG